MRYAKLATNDISYIVYEADNIAASSDRRGNEYDGFRDSELSFILLHRITNYICEKNLADDGEKAGQINDLLNKIIVEDSEFSKLRNDSAHTINNVTEARFREMVRHGSADFMVLVVKLSGLIISRDVIKLSGIYDVLNQSIEKRLG